EKRQHVTGREGRDERLLGVRPFGVAFEIRGARPGHDLTAAEAHLMRTIVVGVGERRRLTPPSRRRMVFAHFKWPSALAIGLPQCRPDLRARPRGAAYYR